MANEGGVAAVDRALTILDAFREGDQSLTLTEISKRVGFYKSTTLRLAESLERFGYLRRLEDGAFRLGPKPLFLGSLYQRHFQLSEFVPPVLRQIAAELNEGASFFVREDDRRVCVHRVESARAIRDVIHEGMRLPLDLGAAGHVIMAFGGAAGTRYDAVRRDLFSASFGERDPEIAAVASPVFAVGQRLVGAISVSGPRYRFEQADPRQMAGVLHTHCAALTAALGGTWPNKPV